MLTYFDANRFTWLVVVLASCTFAVGLFSPFCSPKSRPARQRWCKLQSMIISWETSKDMRKLWRSMMPFKLILNRLWTTKRLSYICVTLKITLYLPNIWNKIVIYFQWIKMWNFVSYKHLLKTQTPIQINRSPFIHYPQLPERIKI